MVRSNPAPLFQFFRILQSNKCQVGSPGGSNNMLKYLDSVQESINDNTNELIAVTRYKAPRRKQPVVAPEFCCSNDAVLCKIRTQQIRQALQKLMVIWTHTL